MKKWTILLLALLCSTAGAAAQDFSVVNPRCEYRDEPLGINTLTPRFSWQISARRRAEQRKQKDCPFFHRQVFV